MLRYFKVLVKKNTKNKGIITDNSNKGSFIVKRVILEVQIGVWDRRDEWSCKTRAEIWCGKGTPSASILK